MKVNPLPIEQAALDRMATAADELRRQTFTAMRHIAGGRLQEATALLAVLSDKSAGLLVDLEGYGATLPDTLPTAPTVPIDLLSTDRNRAFLVSLEECHTRAVLVDQERGTPEVKAGPLARMIEQTVLECHGPQSPHE